MIQLNYKLLCCSIVLGTLLTALAAQSKAGEIVYLGLEENVWQIWAINPDGSGQNQITNTAFDKVRASWYPDGQRLLVNAVDGFVYTVELSSGEESLIPTELSGFQDAVLAPNGRHFTFSLSTSGSVDDNNIWIVNENGTNQQKLTSMPRLQHEPAWNADSNAIYFLSGDGGQSHNIWQIALDERIPRQITANQIYHFDVAVGPDGTLAYSNNRDGNYDLWLRLPDGAERRLTNDSALDARPSWSPDGKQLVFESSRDGGLDLWIIDIESGVMNRLTETGGRARYPVWHQPGEQP